MDEKKLSLEDYQLFLFGALLWLILAWSSFAMALTGFFYSSVLWISFAIVSAWFFHKIILHKIYRKISCEMQVASAVFLLIAFLFSFFSTPTVFSGRDQGSISEAAIRLEQSHALKFSTPASMEFFKLHEKGQAQNFPGFHYTKNGELTTQFPLVYISWLALFYALFNTAGFAIANGILFFIFFISFYLLARLFLKTFFSAIPIVMFTETSFVFMWFSKFTLSENMAMPLLWLAILSLMLFLHNPRKLNYSVFLVSILLVCFTRIEGFGFLIASMVIISLNKEARDYIKSRLGFRLLLPIGIFLAVFFVNAIQDSSFYIEILKTLLPFQDMTTKAKPLGEIKNTVLPNYYVIKIFYLYGLLGFFIFGFFGAILQTYKKDFYKLIPLFVVAPTFIYFLNSHITLDHPWMLRRFMFSLLPAAILYSGILVGQMIEKESPAKKFGTEKFFSIAIISFLVLGNFPAFFKYLTFSENKDLLPQAKALSSQFHQNDLILVDQKTTGDGWSMISGPMSFLYGKNAVYFFNTQDLDKLNLKSFDSVYLISPKERTSFYLNSTIGPRLTPKDDYAFSFSKLKMQQDAPLKTVGLPEKIEFTIHGKIFEIAK